MRFETSIIAFASLLFSATGAAVPGRGRTSAPDEVAFSRPDALLKEIGTCNRASNMCEAQFSDKKVALKCNRGTKCSSPGASCSISFEIKNKRAFNTSVPCTDIDIVTPVPIRNNTKGGNGPSCVFQPAKPAVLPSLLPKAGDSASTLPPLGLEPAKLAKAKADKAQSKGN